MATCSFPLRQITVSIRYKLLKVGVDLVSWSLISSHSEYHAMVKMQVSLPWMTLTCYLYGLQDQARKALEGALGGKKVEFEKWDKEIKKREEVGGGSSGGGGGWFGWGRRFGWSNDDDFWQEAQQASLAVLGILVMVSNFLFYC